MSKVIQTASDIQIAEAKPNDIYMTVRMKMFSTAANRNGHAVTEAFIDQITAEGQDKYHCLPLCVDTAKQIAGDTGTLGHNLDTKTGVFGTEQIGAFHSYEKISDEMGTSLIGEARIAKRNRRVCAALIEMFERNDLSVSFEILAQQMRIENGVTIIDACDGNELVGMAIVSVPACPEAKALALVAEVPKDQDHEEGAKVNMDQDKDQTKRIAELETQLRVAEDSAKKTEGENEELKKKQDALEKDKKEREDKDAATAEQLAQKDQKVAELEAQVKELEVFKVEAETLRAEKDAAALKAKQDELTKFAQCQGLDEKAEHVAKAIAEVDYPALVAEVVKLQANDPKAAKMAPFAIAALKTGSGNEYGGLLDSAE